MDDLLREDKDKAFVIHFDWEVELLQDLTASRQKLESALGTPIRFSSEHHDYVCPLRRVHYQQPAGIRRQHHGRCGED